jgi:hypothetical protein
MAGYIGSKAVSVNTTSATISDDLSVGDDATITGDLDVDGTTNLDVVDIDGAVNIATTALVTGVLTTTARSVSSGGITINNTDSIRPAANNTVITVSGGQATNDGANLSLFGGDHASLADVVRFRSSASETLRIDASGKVGIGLTNPSDYYADQLVVSSPNNGGFTFVGATNAQNYIMWADGTSGADAYRGYIGYSHDNNAFRFGTSGAESMVIDSSGNVSITDGNLVVANGHGIDFSATGDAGGATSELLDDYEEGTFTPTSGVSLSSPTGTYRKVGKLVYVGMRFNMGASSSGSQAIISGLPFTNENTQAARAGLAVGYNDEGNSNGLSALLSSNSTTFAFYLGSTIKSYSNMAGHTVYVGGTYPVA